MRGPFQQRTGSVKNLMERAGEEGNQQNFAYYTLRSVDVDAPEARERTCLNVRTPVESVPGVWPERSGDARGEVSDEEAAALVLKHAELGSEACAKKLVKLAKDRGSMDDITVQVTHGHSERCCVCKPHKFNWESHRVCSLL